MEINKRILAKYYEKAVIEQLKMEYINNGYQIVKDLLLNNIEFDLIVKKNDELIIFEIKIEKWSEKKSKEIIQLRNIAVRELGAKFKIVFVSIPENSDIYIENLDVILAELLGDECIDELSSLASHFFIEEVTDIEIEKIYFENNNYEIKGIGIVSLELQFGSDRDVKNDQGLVWSESFPFSFHILLTKDFELLEVYNLEIDTSD